MPWHKVSEARAHNKDMTTAEAKTWLKIANEQLKAGKSEGDAAHIANGVIKKNREKKASAEALAVEAIKIAGLEQYMDTRK